MFPSSLLLTDNFYRKAWVGMGDRRLKNVGIVMEWVPVGTGLEQELVEREQSERTKALHPPSTPSNDTRRKNSDNSVGGQGEEKQTDQHSKQHSKQHSEQHSAPSAPVPAPNWKARMGVLHAAVMQETGQSATAAAVVALARIKVEMANFQREKDKADNLRQQRLQAEAAEAAEAAEEAQARNREREKAKKVEDAQEDKARRAAAAVERRRLRTTLQRKDIDWQQHPPIEMRGSTKRYFVALTLAEGETVRRLIHDHAQQPVLKYCGIALRTSEGAVLDVSPRFPRALLHDLHDLHDLHGPSTGQSTPTQIDVQCLRFFNSEMYFTAPQLTSLSRALHLSPVGDRLAFFEETLRLRERERNNWSDTPVAKIFTREEDWHLMQGRSALNRLNALFSSIAHDGGTLAEGTLVELFASDKQKEARLHSKESGGDGGGGGGGGGGGETKSNRLAHEWTPSEASICESVFVRFDLEQKGWLSVEDIHRLGVALRLKFDVQDCVELVKLMVAAAAPSPTTTGTTTTTTTGAMASGQTVTKTRFLRSIVAGERYAHLPASCALGTAELTNLDWWACQQCDFLNAAMNDVCVVCQCDWSGVRSIPQGYWSCEGCTKLNSDAYYYCEICGLSKKSLSTMKF